MSGDDPAGESRRWTDLTGEAKGRTYDARWAELEAEGRSVHGEADLVRSLLDDPASATVLDAGCGTGRVAIELARGGTTTVGVDRDPDLLDAARAKAPQLRWVEADLGDLDRTLAPGSVDLAVLAGNVLIFTDPGTEAQVLAAVARTLRPGGLVVAGFQLRRRGYTAEALDVDAAAAGLHLRDRWSTWDREPWHPGDSYQVSVHVSAAPPEG